MSQIFQESIAKGAFSDTSALSGGGGDFSKFFEKVFKKPKSTAEEEARALRRRIASRGGFQSTLLTGGSGIAQANVFKSNLGGTSRARR